MIQPTLMSYKPEQDPEPTLLDSVSIAPDVVLLLDTFFHVLIWHGETVAAWRKAGYHEQEGYEHIKAQMEKPVGDAAVRPKLVLPQSACLSLHDPGTHCRPIPYTKIYRLRRRWLAGSFLAIEAQPLDHPHEWRLWSRSGASYLYR